MKRFFVLVLVFALPLVARADEWTLEKVDGVIEFGRLLAAISLTFLVVHAFRSGIRDGASK